VPNTPTARARVKILDNGNIELAMRQMWNCGDNDRYVLPLPSLGLSEG
jgi:hypothetical protein